VDTTTWLCTASTVVCDLFGGGCFALELLETLQGSRLESRHVTSDRDLTGSLDLRHSRIERCNQLLGFTHGAALVSPRSSRLRGMFRVVEYSRDRVVGSRARSERDGPSEEADRHRGRERGKHAHLQSCEGCGRSTLMSQAARRMAGGFRKAGSAYHVQPAWTASGCRALWVETRYDGEPEGERHLGSGIPLL
jgi:hypothetical protein